MRMPHIPDHIKSPMHVNSDSMRPVGKFTSLGPKPNARPDRRTGRNDFFPSPMVRDKKSGLRLGPAHIVRPMTQTIAHARANQQSSAYSSAARKDRRRINNQYFPMR